jgi:hypothetical protein
MYATPSGPDEAGRNPLFAVPAKSHAARPLQQDLRGLVESVAETTVRSHAGEVYQCLHLEACWQHRVVMTPTCGALSAVRWLLSFVALVLCLGSFGAACAMSQAAQTCCNEFGNERAFASDESTAIGFANASSCRGARGSYQNGQTVDGQAISGGPFSGSLTWPQYTCINGLWLCAKFCGANAGRYFIYRNGLLVPIAKSSQFPADTRAGDLADAPIHEHEAIARGVAAANAINSQGAAVIYTDREPGGLRAIPPVDPLTGCRQPLISANRPALRPLRAGFAGDLRLGRTDAERA